MESILGFDEHLQDDVVEDKSHSFKLVPWISWDEWKFVRESLFSSSPDSVASALRRISTWRSRGCTPVSVEVTASIVEIQQKDPYFRNDLNDSSSQSEEMLAMLYCMAIMRLVNGVVEKTRKKNEISIGEAADAIGIPRMLIDIRHEGSHRDLPSLQLVRLASNKALDWLVSYYWEPQEKAIPIQNNQTANLRKEIKRRLREVALCLKVKQMEKSSSSQVKGKRSKKQLDKSLKHTLRLYSSFSSEVIYILLKYLLNALDSSNSDHFEDSESVSQTAFDDWKTVVLKLSRKEPDFLVTLTQAVLEKMESNKAMDCKIDQSHKNYTKSRKSDLLSQLLAWLIDNLKALNPVILKESIESKNPKTEKHLTESTVLALLRRCLLISSPNNKQLMKSALNLAQLTVNASLLQKLKKLALLNLLPNSESNSVNSCNEEISIREAEERFELIKRRMKGKYGKVNRSEVVVGAKTKWSVARSWNLCPIGMLPSKIGFSGQLPDLEIVPLSDSNEDCKTILGKREAETGVEEMDITPAKKLETGPGYSVMRDIQGDVSGESVKGRLMIDGTWKRVGDEELFAIASAVKLLV
ncbi:protein las1 [Phtheirospermum japonicum]|uniref:Protein las1 n=1 Tax=Phtheirospermum japonicum TaxID=374723 RepID=A0A830B9W1_9LAMI|nr:protein las1 [Phtheirospermum japonicum]